MFLFNNDWKNENNRGNGFKYISCFYSTSQMLHSDMRHHCLNTYHVSIQRENEGKEVKGYYLFKYISCFYSTKNLVGKQFKPQLFKYISCFYSTSSCIFLSSELPAFKYISCFYSTVKLKAQFLLTEFV